MNENLLNFIRNPLLVSIVCVMCAAISVTPAEVAVSVSNGGSASLYELQSIIDDPEPVGIVWARYNDDSETRIVLNDQGQANGDGPPTMLVTSLGVPVVAWSRNAAGAFDVVASRFVAGAWTTPEVLAGAAADELDPVLIEDPANGTIHLLYAVQDASPRVMHRQASADLSSWSAPVQVSQPGEPACRPDAVFHDGVLQIVYEVHDFGLGTTPRQIVLATYDGQQFSPGMVAITHHPGVNSPRVHTAYGTLWVDWIDAANEVGWTRKTPGGSWENVQIEPFATTEERDYHVRGAVRVLALQ